MADKPIILRMYAFIKEENWPLYERKRYKEGMRKQQMGRYNGHVYPSKNQKVIIYWGTEDKLYIQRVKLWKDE